MSEIETVELIDYLRVVWKRKWLIAIGTIVCALTAFGVSLTLPRVYQTSVTFMSTEPSFQVQLEPRIQTRINPSLSLATYTKIIKNRALEEEVAKGLKADFGVEGLTAEGLDGMVSVDLEGGTSLIKMTVEDIDPKRAAQIANVWADLFVKENRELSYKNTRKIQEFTVEQLEVAKDNLEASEEEARRFKEANQISALEKRIDSRLVQLVGYEARLNEISLTLYKERENLKTQIEQLVRDRLNYYRSKREEARLRLEKENHSIKGILKQLVQDELASYRVLLNNTGLALEKERLGLEELRRQMESQRKLGDPFKPTTDNSTLPNSFVRSDGTNPVYISLKEKEVESSLMVESLVAQTKKTHEAIASLSTELARFDKSIADGEGSVDNFLEIVNSIKSSIDSYRISSGRNSTNNSVLVVLNNDTNSGDDSKTIIAQDREVALGNSILAAQGLQLEIEQISSRVHKLEAILGRVRFEPSPTDVLKIDSLTKMVDDVLSDLSGVITLGPSDKSGILSSILSIRVLLAEADRLSQSIKGLNGEIDSLKVRLADEQLRLTRLDRTVAIATDTYRTLSQKNEETKISAATVTGNIEIIEPAYPPSNPIKPRVRLNTLIAGVVGFMVAVALAFFIDYVSRINARK